jgi:hypothetical protein
MAVGAPVDLMNNAPRVLNALPGEQGFGPITDSPVGGRETIDTILRGGGVIPDYQPQNGLERVINRIGEEIGATTVPMAGGLAYAGGKSVSAMNRMANSPRTLGEALTGALLQPAAVNPSGLAAREGTYAVGAGAGAGIANEAAGPNAGPLSDTLGSFGGVLGTAAGAGLLGALRNLAAGATGSPGMMDDVAGQAVADRLINSSTRLGQQFASTGRVDTQPLADGLRIAAPVEQAVPGYRANLADRASDPGLSTFAYNADAVAPGAANARRVGNDEAIGARMTELAPVGSPGRFRADLQAGVDARIAEVQSEADFLRQMFGDQVAGLQPGMADATARGSAVRAGVADAYGTAQQGVRDAYGQLNDGVILPGAPLREAFGAVDARLPVNDAARFRPSEANVPAQLAPPAPADPVPTGLLDASGQPMMRQPPAAPDGVPLSEVMAVRQGLTDDIRTNRAAGQRRAAHVGGQYLDPLDDFIAQNLPPEEMAKFDAAKAQRRDVADRFERPGTGIESVLRPREGGGYALDDSAVPSTFAQPDQGRVTDLRALLTEAGSDQRVRDGLADQVRSEVVQRGLLDKPEQLGRYVGERGILLSEFPELRAALETAGTTRAQLNAAEKTARETETALTSTRTPEGSYLRYSNERVTDSVRTMINAPDPRAAAKQLAERANTPTARQDLKSALWEEVKNRGQFSAANTEGGARWNGRVLRDLIDDPKFAAAADELWSDNPEDLANIRKVFEALAAADGSTRARAPGSSGTAQALTGKFDPSLSTSSIASRARSVQRGQLSPVIAVVDVMSTWLRNKSAQVQSRAIDQLTAAVVNNPGMAADLLERYNPATAGAYKQMMTQKYGARGTNVLNALEAGETEEDPLMDAIQEGR